MDDTTAANSGGEQTPQQQQHYNEQDHQHTTNDRRPGFYALQSNQSSTSIFEDVEMAHDEVRSSLLVPNHMCLPPLQNTNSAHNM